MRKPTTGRTSALRAAPALLEAAAGPMFDAEASAASGGDADAVHDMRVASRRLRAALDVLGALYPRKRAAAWERTARSVTRALGRVRDADVFIAEFAAMRRHAATPAERVALAYIIGRRQGERTRDLARMRRTVSGLDLPRMRSAFRAFARAPRDTAASRVPLAALAREQVTVRLEAAISLAAAAQPAAAADAQHRLRIALKRLRYSVETLRPALGPGCTDVLATLKRLQDALGELHDRDLFLVAVRAIAADGDAASAGVTRAALAAVTRRLRAERAELHAAFRVLWSERGGATLRVAVLAILPPEDA